MSSQFCICQAAIITLEKIISRMSYDVHNLNVSEYWRSNSMSNSDAFLDSGALEATTWRIVLLPICYNCNLIVICSLSDQLFWVGASHTLYRVNFAWSSESEGSSSSEGSCPHVRILSPHWKNEHEVPMYSISAWSEYLDFEITSKLALLNSLLVTQSSCL